jgi:hypothetical protein
MPTNEEVEGDVIAYFTCKGYYTYGLKVEYFINEMLFIRYCNEIYSLPLYAFCDANCKFVMIASKLCSSLYNNTSYIVTQLSIDIKSGLLPQQYLVV